MLLYRLSLRVAKWEDVKNRLNLKIAEREQTNGNEWCGLR